MAPDGGTAGFARDACLVRAVAADICTGSDAFSPGRQPICGILLTLARVDFVVFFVALRADLADRPEVFVFAECLFIIINITSNIVVAMTFSSKNSNIFRWLSGANIGFRGISLLCRPASEYRDT
jgi:hypothetical protein